MLSPALFVLVFALSPFLLALLGLFQSAQRPPSRLYCSGARLPVKHPLRTCPPRLGKARAFLLSLLQGFPFSFYIPLICSVLACSSLRILFFSRINYTAAHPSLRFSPPRVFPFARLPFMHRLLSSRLFLPAVFPFLCKTKEGAWPSLFTVPCCFSYPPQSTAAGISPRWRCALPAFY